MDDNKSQLRIWWRHWSIVLILAILAGLVIWGMVNLGPWLKNFQDWRTAKSVQEKTDKIYQDDKYAGSTAEEALRLFIETLERGDIELASRYFVADKQKQWSKTLKSYKEGGFLDNFIEELRSSSSHDFKLYPNGSWKINDL